MKYLNYLQIPYRHMGATFQGADCYGLLYLFYRNELKIDLPLPEFEYAEEWWKDNSYILDLYKTYNFRRLKGEPLRFGDVILFRNTNNCAGHIGIVLDEAYFLHMSKAGCVIGNYAYGLWARQIHSAYRYKRQKCSSK